MKSWKNLKGNKTCETGNPFLDMFAKAHDIKLAEKTRELDKQVSE